MKLPEPYAYQEINRFIDHVPDYIRGLKEFWKGIVQQWDGILSRFTNNYFIMMHSEEILIGIIALVLLALAGTAWWIKGGKKRRKKYMARPASPKEARKAGKAASRMGDYVKAGEFFEHAGDYKKAIDNYKRGRAVSKAARVMADKLGQTDKALNLLIKNELWDGAARLYADLDMHEEAGNFYLKAKKPQMAAESFEKAGLLEKAGKLYAKASRIQEAARCYSRAEMWPQAAEMYVALYKELRKAISGDQAGKREWGRLQGRAKQAAHHLKQAGQFARAGELLMDAKMEEQAAQMFGLAGETARAAAIFEDKQDYKQAAEMYHKAGDKQKAASLMAAQFQSQGQQEEAAKYMEMAGDYLAAADIYAGRGMHEKAAGLYLKGGDTRTASEMLMAAGKADQAVAIFEQQGDIDAAITICEEMGDNKTLAALYERTGRHYEAARLYEEQGDARKAGQLYNKVVQDHPYFGHAQYRLGELYAHMGDYSRALEKLQNMAGRLALMPDTLDQYYLLAQVYEKLEHYVYAVTIYQQIAAYHYHYKDVVMRINALAGKAQEELQKRSGGWSRPGGTVGRRYKIIKELGRGGMGVVYLAEDMHLGRKVAFKVLPEELKADKLLVNMFVKEATSLAKLNHPYIVSIFDAGEEAGVYFIIMEYVEGKNFKELRGGSKRLPVAAGIKVFTQLAQALDYAHGLNIIHRDIKPANIMWTSTQIIKVMDFGLAKVMDQMREGKTQVAGTPLYMSPEQTMGKHLDHRTDIYSMGVTVYELLTGTVPFKEGDIGYHHMHTPPVPPRKLNEQIPAQVETAILKCMAKDPAQRYQSAAEVYEELHRNFG